MMPVFLSLQNSMYKFSNLGMLWRMIRENDVENFFQEIKNILDKKIPIMEREEKKVKP